jgi:hypothetical protein
MSKFEKILKEYTAPSSIAINPDSLKKRVESLLKPVQGTPEGEALRTVSGAVDDGSSNDSQFWPNIINQLQKNPKLLSTMTPEQQEFLKPFFQNSENNSNAKGQTNGQNPSLDSVQKQQSPTTSSSPANKAMR